MGAILPGHPSIGGARTCSYAKPLDEGRTQAVTVCSQIVPMRRLFAREATNRARAASVCVQSHPLSIQQGLPPNRGPAMRQAILRWSQGAPFDCGRDPSIGKPSRIKLDVYEKVPELGPMCTTRNGALRKDRGRSAADTLGAPKSSYTSALSPNPDPRAAHASPSCPSGRILRHQKTAGYMGKDGK